MKDQLANQLNAAQQRLAAAITSRAAAVQALNSAEANLMNAEAEAQRPLSDAEKADKEANKNVRKPVEGGNEQSRKAEVISRCAAQHTAVFNARNAKVQAEAEYDLAKLDFDLAKQLVTVFTSLNN